MAATSLQYSCLGVLHTELHCNALHFNEQSGSLLCAMYEHVADRNVRVGAMHSASLPNVLDESAWQRVNLDLTKTSGEGDKASGQVEGIFDVRTFQGASFPQLLAGRTDGSVTVFSASGDALPEAKATIAVGAEMVTTAFGAGNGALIATHHKGDISLVDAEASCVMRSWKGHDFDAWHGDSLGAPDSGLAEVATGGDDGKLKLWDLRIPIDEGEVPMAVGTCRFDAGVVAVLGPGSHRNVGNLGDNQLLVGTYDEIVAIVDVRQMKRPVATLNVGGGAWRLRPKAGGSAGGNFVVAAMHGGAVDISVNASDADAPITEVARFHCHKEDVLVYDVAPLPDGRVASVSFYDNELCVWTPATVESAEASA